MDHWVAQLETIHPFLSSMLALLHHQLLTLSPSTQTRLQRTLHWSVSPPHRSRCSYIDCSYKSRNPSHHIAPTWTLDMKLRKGCSCPNAPEGHTIMIVPFKVKKRRWFCTYSGHCHIIFISFYWPSMAYPNQISDLIQGRMLRQKSDSFGHIEVVAVVMSIGRCQLSLLYEVPWKSPTNAYYGGYVNN